MSRYKEYILKKIRLRKGIEPDDKSKDEILNKLSPNEVFFEVLNWEGLIGSWDRQIKNWIKDIYKIDLDDFNCLHTNTDVIEELKSGYFKLKCNDCGYEFIDG